MIVYHSDAKIPPDTVQTTVRIPTHLHEYARECGINLSGTLRSVLEDEYVARAHSRQTVARTKRARTHGDSQ